jgi:cellulose synthase/poly-beta-1,6-N-acetylglucosamine synthase-like glycosyltransferase
MDSVVSSAKKRLGMSFLVPVKNVSQHFENLRSQIEENLEDNDEVVIVNDHSTDNTSALLDGWSKSNPQVNVIVNSGEKGLISSLNLGLMNSNKDWVARFDADDMYRSNRLFRQAQFISDNTVAVFADYEFISSAGRKLGSVPSAVYPTQTSLSLVMGNRTAHPSVIFNRKAALEVGAYRSQDYLAEDLSLWLRMSRLGKLRSVPEVLLSYRLNPSSVTINSRELSQKMKRSVISEIGINPIDLETALAGLDTLQTMYSEDSSRIFRELLFLRDVREALNASGRVSDKAVLKELAQKTLASSIKTSPRIARSVIEKVRRDVYRKGILISKN